MGPEDVFLSIREPASSYRFVCPACESPVAKVADRKVVALLLSAGVNVTDRRTVRPSLRADARRLPAFTGEDVAGFRRLLADDSFLNRLVESG